ncbi:nestin [Gadus morhua]|uniref:nestin n=1 Tax=Gadus morhua TaxID=8049 RepID=UPI0011B52A4D|nr:nestin-like [Gadus morhua]
MDLQPPSRPHRCGGQPRGGEGPQMLGLNRRLEAYLGRVQQLEGQNHLLRREIQALRQGQQEERWGWPGLDKELGRARAEVEAACGERDRVELEAGCLARELQELGQHRQWLAQAQQEVQAQLEDSARELEQEQRAHMWLREKVEQLEQEIHLQIQGHQEDVEHLEASLCSSRPAAGAPFPGPGQQAPSVLELGQEYSARATQAWAEADEAYQSQVLRLEESLDQARAQLNEVGQERSQSQQKLRFLEKELAVAREVMAGLERNMSHQEDTHHQELQHLQGHLQELECKKGELGEQMERLLEDSHRLLQHKTALGLVVTTYRALLDKKERTPAVKAPRNVYITDSRQKGMRSNYRTQVSAPRHYASQRSSFNGVHDKSRSPVTTKTSCGLPRSSVWDRTPPKQHNTTSSAGGLVDDRNPEKCVTSVTLYPKIQRNGTEEHFRHQEVHEEVTYAEPLSPPNEQEALEESLVHQPTMESPVMHSMISCKVESGLNTFKPAFNAEEKHWQIPIKEKAIYRVDTEERSAPFLDKNRENYSKPTPFDAWVEPGQALGDTSDSEAEAVYEPRVGSNTSDLASEGEPEASIFDQVVFNPEENAAGIHADGSLLRKVQSESEDKLYPDGEEMDTWDSVIERKAELKKEQSLEMDTRHAEPEDMSAREPGQQEVAKVNVVAFTEEDVHSSLIVTPTGTQFSDTNQDQIPLLEQGQENVNNEEEDEEDEDSQNVSVSWRTEVESDSYAQDNTLADTRPLIQYKSDEADGNNQASHCDDLESSDGEDKMEAGGTGSGTWSDGKSKRFGTMDDLCEETDEDAEKVGYDMSYAHGDDQDVVTKEHATLRTDCEEEKEQVQMIMKDGREHSDEETEDLTQRVIPKKYSNVNMDYSEDLENVDRLVELELEGLSTTTYTAHFAKHQASKSEIATSIQEAKPQGVGETIGEEMFIRVEHSMKAHQELLSTSATNDRPNEQLFLDDTQYIQDEDEEARNTLITENNDSNAAIVTDDESVAIDFNEGFDGQEIIDDCVMELSNGSGDESPNDSPYRPPISTEQGTSDLQDALVEATVYHELHKAETVEESEAPPKHSVDVDTDQEVCSVAAQIVKWEGIGNPAEATGQFAAGERCENVEATTESNLDFPEAMQDERDILQVKSSTESIMTNYKIEKDLHSFSSSDVDADFLGSSVLTGANYQPKSSFQEATGEVSPNHSQGDNLVLGSLDEQHVAMGISRMEGGMATSQVTKGEFEQRSSERKLYECKDAAEEGLTHSEDSEEEGHSWSSGEE